MQKLAAFAVITVLFTWPRLTADTIILKSGETIQGEILSDTNGVLQVKVGNASRTSFSTLTIPQSDVVGFQREAREKKEPVQPVAPENMKQQMQEAYLNTLRYKLSTTSFLLEYYDQVINDVFRKFLIMYPSSSYSNVIDATIKEWTAEREKVAAGSVKWNGQWYGGDEAKKFQTEIKLTQLLSDGDQQLSNGEYEAAATKYREALSIRPLSIESIEAINQKAEVACQKWKEALVTYKTQLDSDLKNCEATERQLDAQRRDCEKSLEEWKKNAAQNNASNRRTIYGNQPTSYNPVKRMGSFNNIITLENSLKQVDAAIAQNEATKARINGELKNFRMKPDAPTQFLRKCENAVRSARSDAQQAAKDAKEEARLKAAEATRLAQVAARDQQASRAQAARDQVAREEAIRLEARRQEAAARESSRPKEAMPAPPAEPSWLEKHFGKVLIGIFSLLGAFIVFRR